MTIALTLLVLLVLGVPLFVVIGAVAALAFAIYAGHAGIDGLQVLIVKMTSLTTKNVFLAIPFFVISGAIMSAGSIARRLVAVAEALVGGMRGGLAIAALIASVIFAALSGSSPVTLIAIGGIMFPAMIRAGYREPFALGFVTTAGSLGCLVPPSIPMLVYAISVTGTSAVDVRELFLAGLGAAVMVAALLALYAVVRAGPVAAGAAFSWARLRTALREGAWALALPLLILGGIYGGLFTPTEASAVSVVYALLVETVIHRSLGLARDPGRGGPRGHQPGRPAAGDRPVAGGQRLHGGGGGGRGGAPPGARPGPGSARVPAADQHVPGRHRHVHGLDQRHRAVHAGDRAGRGGAGHRSAPPGRGVHREHGDRLPGPAHRHQPVRGRQRVQETVRPGQPGGAAVAGRAGASGSWS